LAISLAQLGRVAEACEALKQAVALAPEGFTAFVHSRPPWYRPETYDHVLDGLRKAGWQG
jgi:adenylate cyclase